MTETAERLWNVASSALEGYFWLRRHPSQALAAMTATIGYLGQSSARRPPWPRWPGVPALTALASGRTGGQVSDGGP